MIDPPPAVILKVVAFELEGCTAKLRSVRANPNAAETSLFTFRFYRERGTWFDMTFDSQGNVQ